MDSGFSLCQRNPIGSLLVDTPCMNVESATSNCGDMMSAPPGRTNSVAIQLFGHHPAWLGDARSANLSSGTHVIIYTSPILVSR